MEIKDMSILDMSMKDMSIKRHEYNEYLIFNCL